MLSLEGLTDHLQQDNPYPCLNFLEAALVCHRLGEDQALPVALLDDMGAMFGNDIVEMEAEKLVDLGILIKKGRHLLLKPEGLTSISALLNQLRKDLPLSLGQINETAAVFIQKLLAYLTETVPGIILTESADTGEFTLSWQNSTYNIRLAFSPVWLPAAAEEAAEKQTYVALFGPFSAQNWLQLLKYYSYPEFRHFTAYYDPWHRQKMHISRGGLFSYFDWFFRDVYRLKFFIPKEFSLALHNMGLLRYNDEK